MEEQLTPRPEVAAYAQRMEAKLRAHDDRPGWKTTPPAALFSHLLEEVCELGFAIGYRPVTLLLLMGDSLRKVPVPTRVTLPMIADEAADVGNMSMMVADACGALPAPLPRQPEPIADDDDNDYEYVTSAILQYLPQFVHEDDVAASFIYAEAI